MSDRAIRYDEPFAWWGPAWRAQPARGLADLVDDGVVTNEQAARLMALVARRASVVVVAEPSRAGKSTLLAALAALLPDSTRRVYLRGCYEPFAFLADPAHRPAATALLINEISPHLPIYLWGPGVRRALQAGLAGCQLFATAHARTVEQFVGSLAGAPLRVPLTEIAAFRVIAILDRSAAADRFRLAALWGLAPTARGGLLRLPLDDEAAMAAVAPAASDAPLTEIAVCRRLLAEHPGGFRAPKPPRWPAERAGDSP
jgi:energy-coupling factor transporter ATP-binding protein EcfA2